MAGIPGLTNVLNPSGGGVDLASSAESGAVYGAPVNVGTTAPNLGNLLQGFAQPPQTGGSGLRLAAPGFGSGRGATLSIGGNNTLLYAGGAAVLLLVVAALATSKRRR